MARLSGIAVVVALLTGCATLPPAQVSQSPCAIHEASYECQVERYHNVNVP